MYLNMSNNSNIYKIILAIILIASWYYCSAKLTQDPNSTLTIIGIFLGILGTITFVIQYLLKESIQEKIRKLLDAQIKEQKEVLLEGLKELVSYLEEEKYPNYEDSNVEGPKDAFRRFDKLKSKYEFRPKVIQFAVLTIASSLLLILFWVIPPFTLFYLFNLPINLSHIGIGLYLFGLWKVISILLTSMEIEIWEDKP